VFKIQSYEARVKKQEARNKSQEMWITIAPKTFDLKLILFIFN
jgi:hypothetical protein